MSCRRSLLYCQLNTHQSGAINSRLDPLVVRLLAGSTQPAIRSVGMLLYRPIIGLKSIYYAVRHVPLSCAFGFFIEVNVLLDNEVSISALNGGFTAG